MKGNKRKKYIQGVQGDLENQILQLRHDHPIEKQTQQNSNQNIHRYTCYHAM